LLINFFINNIIALILLEDLGFWADELNDVLKNEFSS